MYRCRGCGRELETIDMRAPFRCPYCGCRVLFKERAPVAKHVKAR